MPVVSEGLSKFDSNIYVRIFKLIGPICMTIIISGIGLKLNKIYFYIIIFISISYILYKLYYVYRNIKHWFYNVRNGNLLVRNSPLDFLGSIGKAGGYTIKSIVNLSVGTGLTYALCHELDDILEKEGKEPFFIPRLKKGIEASGLNAHVSEMLKKVGIEDLQNVKKSITVPEVIDKLNSEERIAFEKDNKGLTVDQFKEAHKYIEEKYNSSSSNYQSELNTEISKLIDKKPFDKKE